MDGKGTGKTLMCFEYFDEYENLFVSKPNIKPVAIVSSSTPSIT